ncbi:MAG: hypothetical protein JNL93_05315 [Pelomonas sp.]|nr:hypothetical protein [Roseateles sp.]
MVATLLRPPMDALVLPAGDAVAFVDAATGAPVLEGLRLSLVMRQGGRLLGRAVASPSGAWHWPELAERWRVNAPGTPVLADVIVRDEQGRFLPLSLPWPLPATPVGQVMSATVLGASRLLQVRLLSAPGRRAPPGAASVYAQLAWQASGAPAAWARVRLTDGDGRLHEGACDAEGRLALHLPRPRPNRPGSPPAPAAQLAVFWASALADASLALGAPDALAFASQPAVLALADVGTTVAYVPPVFNPGEPLILATVGLPATQRELRLAPI